MKNDSECKRLFHSIDWSKHPLGIPENWPQSLLSTLSIIFNSKFPMFLYWGPDLYCFYNDAFRPSMGNNGKHPGTMGEKGKVAWPEIWDVIYPELEQVMNGGDSTWHENQYLPIFRNNRMEDVYWTYSYSPVIGESGKVAAVLVTCNETTAQVLTEKKLVELTMELKIKAADLKKLNRELEQFVYIASHDLQEPLRTTTSFIELLQRQYHGKLDEKADKYFNFILGASSRMKTLIKDLLDYSRIGAKKEFVTVDCNLVIKEILADLGSAVNESQAVITTSRLPVITGYPEIKQLFQNLIINAIKFRKKDIAPQIEVAVEDKGSYLQFLVKDNGIGIEEQYKEKIFLIFQRLHTKTAYEGSGIGLAHAKKIVELHGGKIWVESIQGVGATFHFTIQKDINPEKENDPSAA